MSRHEVDRPGGIPVANLPNFYPRVLWLSRRWHRDAGSLGHDDDCHPVPAATLIARHLAARVVDDITGGAR